MAEHEDFEEPDFDEATPEDFERFLNKSHTFEDGDRIEVVQMKRRDSGPWVTYKVYQGPGIPRQLNMTLAEFKDTFGHLFGDEEQ